MEERPGTGRCQVQGCQNSLAQLKGYYRRYRICKEHAGLQEFMWGGVMSRFCQQCATFQPLHDFEGTKSSCRAILARHNERRAKKRAAQRPINNAMRAARPGGFPHSGLKRGRSGNGTSSHSSSTLPTDSDDDHPDHGLLQRTQALLTVGAEEHDIYARQQQQQQQHMLQGTGRMLLQQHQQQQQHHALSANSLHGLALLAGLQQQAQAGGSQSQQQSSTAGLLASLRERENQQAQGSSIQEQIRQLLGGQVQVQALPPPKALPMGQGVSMPASSGLELVQLSNGSLALTPCSGAGTSQGIVLSGGGTAQALQLSSPSVQQQVQQQQQQVQQQQQQVQILLPNGSTISAMLPMNQPQPQPQPQQQAQPQPHGNGMLAIATADGKTMLVPESALLSDGGGNFFIDPRNLPGQGQQPAPKSQPVFAVQQQQQQQQQPLPTRPAQPINASHADVLRLISASGPGAHGGSNGNGVHVRLELGYGNGSPHVPGVPTSLIKHGQAQANELQSLLMRQGSLPRDKHQMQMQQQQLQLQQLLNAGAAAPGSPARAAAACMQQVQVQQAAGRHADARVAAASALHHQLQQQAGIAIHVTQHNQSAVAAGAVASSGVADAHGPGQQQRSAAALSTLVSSALNTGQQQRSLHVATQAVELPVVGSGIHAAAASTAAGGIAATQSDAHMQDARLHTAERQECAAPAEAASTAQLIAHQHHQHAPRAMLHHQDSSKTREQEMETMGAGGGGGGGEASGLLPSAAGTATTTSMGVEHAATSSDAAAHANGHGSMEGVQAELARLRAQVQALSDVVASSTGGDAHAHAKGLAAAVHALLLPAAQGQEQQAPDASASLTNHRLRAAVLALLPADDQQEEEGAANSEGAAPADADAAVVEHRNGEAGATRDLRRVSRALKACLEIA